MGDGNRNSRNAESRKKTRSLLNGVSNEGLLLCILAIVTALCLRAPGSIPNESSGVSDHLFLTKTFV